MLRHPYNSNLKIHHDPEWNGLKVQSIPGGLVVSYLEKLQRLLDLTVDQCVRDIVIRFDLHFPIEFRDMETIVITRFINAFKASIEADRRKKERQGIRTYPCVPRFAWAKERVDSQNYHYHVVITLNRDAYFTLGAFKTAKQTEELLSGALDPGVRENLADRIRAAWAGALTIPLLAAIGLVHFPKNPVYTLDRNSEEFSQQYAEAFFRLSYLAKAVTKCYGDNGRHFDCSRK